MVPESPFCGKASEDANAHLQHFLEICSTLTIRGVTQDVVRLRLFPFSLLGKVKQWFHSNKEAVSTWEKCSNAFLAKFFLLGKNNALRNTISTFQQVTDEIIAEVSHPALAIPWSDPLVQLISSFAIRRVRVDEIEKEERGEVNG
jgi:hypothetical protein